MALKRLRRDSLPHFCHARGCNVRVPRKMFMCRTHWFQIPLGLQHRIWDTYSPGQEDRMDPTPEYLAATREAILIVAQKENRLA
jgi:hypothetical protein